MNYQALSENIKKEKTKMKNTEILSEGYLNILRENYTEDKINMMSRKDILNAYLEWYGIIGYTSNIIGIIEDLFPYDLTGTNSITVTERDFDYKIDECEEKN
jgi:hypothetical protein